MNELVRLWLIQLCKRARIDPSHVRGLSTSSIIEIAQWENVNNVQLPTIYKDYLVALGPSHDAIIRDNIEGNVASVADFIRLRNVANEVLEECDATFRLPSNAFVITIYQLESFIFFFATNEDDPPVYHYDCGDEMYWRSHDSISDFFKDLLAEKWG